MATDREIELKTVTESGHIAKEVFAQNTDPRSDGRCAAHRFLGFNFVLVQR